MMAAARVVSSDNMSRLHTPPPLSKHRPDVLKSTLTNKNQIIKLTITQMHTHFTQLYIAGNFPYLTDVVRISGREWGPTRPSHHLNLFPFMLFLPFRSE